MAVTLELMDGFDTYTTVTQRWTSTTGASTTNATAGRRGGGAYVGGGGSTLNKNLSGNYPNLLLGLALEYTSTITVQTLAAFRDSGTNQVDMRSTVTGAIQITRNGTVLATSATGLLGTLSQWNFLEFRATIASGTSGSAEVLLNGVSVVSITGTNTQASANAYANQLQINVTNAVVDDIYLYVGTAGSVPSYKGDCAVKAFAPAADGTYTQWTPNSGTAHFSRVNETPPDDDTSYNSTSTAGNRDSFTIPTVASGTVYAIQHVIRHRVDDAGAHTIQPFVRIGGVNYDGASIASNASYVTSTQIAETSPATSSAWTPTELNSAEFGVKYVS